MGQFFEPHLFLRGQLGDPTLRFLSNIIPVILSSILVRGIKATMEIVQEQYMAAGTTPASIQHSDVWIKCVTEISYLVPIPQSFQDMQAIECSGL